MKRSSNNKNNSILETSSLDSLGWDGSGYETELIAKAITIGLSYNELKKRWPNRTRKNVKGRVPQGYKINQYDPHELIPDLETILLFEEAFDAHEQDGLSFRKIADALEDKSKEQGIERGFAYGSQTVFNLYKKHRKPFSLVKGSQEPKQLRKRDNDLTRLIRKKAGLTKTYNSIKDKKVAVEKEVEKKKIQRELKKNPKTQKLDLSLFNKPGLPKTPDQIVKERQKESNVIFRPNPGPQTEFLESSARETLYGGAAGGGKSYALLADPMRYFDNPNFTGLLVRRTNDELRELKQKSLELYSKAFPGSKFSKRDSSWTFPSGATLWMTYLEQEDDVYRYQGQSFCWIAFDELTQYPTPTAWNYLRSRLRSTDPSIPLSMRATANPGGPGHSWVKKMFVDPSPPNKAFWATDIDSGEVLRYPETHKDIGLRGKALFTRKFIPASLYDNPYLMADGNYEANLLSLPEHERRRLLEGDWSIVDGAAFSEFNPKIHTCDPFEIPTNWHRFRSCDFGYSSHSACLWIAVDPAFDTLYVYRELYVSKKNGEDLGRLIKQTEIDAGDRVTYGILDSSCWHQRGQQGSSIADSINKSGLRFRPSDRRQGSRISGKNKIHEMLKYNEDIEQPRLIIFNTCRQLISDLPSIPVCPKGTDDIDQRFQSDHTYDALRYAVSFKYPKIDPYIESQFMTEDSYRPVDAVFGY